MEYKIHFLGIVTFIAAMLGVTKPVVMHVRLNKERRNPLGKFICGLSATAEIKRSDFGMTDYLPLVGDKVNITIEVEGTREEKSDQAQYNH